MTEQPHSPSTRNQHNNYQPLNPVSPIELQYRNNQFNSDEPSLQKSDLEYFSSLKNYRTLCYSGQGAPFLLVNDNWWASLGCVVFFDIIFCFSIAIFIITGNSTPEDTKPNDSIFPAANQRTEYDSLVIILSSIICLIVINISYFFCQFMNPGIINVTNLADEEFGQSASERKFCQRCCCYRSQNMEHCKECNVCVWGLDHHCGFFNKCIAGWQKWAFYTFLTSLFCGFLLIVVCIGLTLTLM